MSDKTNLPQDPWMDEPDEKQGEYKGYTWVIKRNKLLGNLCGYVIVTDLHPLYEIAQQKNKDNNDRWYPDFDVHGGITFAQMFSNPEGEKLYIIGFDCAHFNDFWPAMPDRYKDALKKLTEEYLTPDHPLQLPPVEYRDMAYVQKECEKLIDQLIEQEKGTE